MQQRTPHAIVWAIVSIAWILHGLVYADELANPRAPGSRAFDWPDALAFAFAESVLCWIALSVFLIEIVRRVSLATPHRLIGLFTLAGAIVGVLTLRALYVWLVYPPLAYWHDGTTTTLPFLDVLTRCVRMHAVRVTLIAGVAYAWFHASAARTGRRRIAQLESGLARARVDAQSTHLNPGFIFNALETIALRIRADPEDAVRLLLALSSLLRRRFADRQHEVTLHEEAALAAQFVALERVRVGEPLDLAMAIEPDCADALVPALILQPLIESAIERRPVAGAVYVAVRHDCGVLIIDIDGGRPAAAHVTKLAAVRTRLRSLYGDGGALMLAPDGHVRVELPLHYAPQTVMAAA